MDEVKSRERLLCAYMAGRDGMVKLRMPFDEEQLEALMAQETLPELLCSWIPMQLLSLS